MAHLYSRKKDRRHGGKSAKHMDAALHARVPVVFGEGAVFNFDAGERSFQLYLTREETRIVAEHFASAFADRAAPPSPDPLAHLDTRDYQRTADLGRGGE